jgi:conjugal transfer/entry exclusion protein
MDIREARPWFWILFVLVFAVAVVGLVLAISAKNSSVDENKVVEEATAEIREELDGLNGAIEAADEFQEESDKESAKDRARIKAAIEGAEAGVDKRLRNLSGRVKSLEGETEDLAGKDTKQAKQIEELVADQETAEAEIARINQRLRNITANGG